MNGLNLSPLSGPQIGDRFLIGPWIKLDAFCKHIRNGLPRLRLRFSVCIIWQGVNTLRPGQDGRHFADDIFKYIFLNENIWIVINISLKFVSKGQSNNIPLSEVMVVSLLTHICVARPPRVKYNTGRYRWRETNPPITKNSGGGTQSPSVRLEHMIERGVF